MTTEAIPNTNTAASKAQIGYGGALSIGPGLVPASAAYVQVAEVTDVDWSGFNVGKEEVTNLGSPNATKEYIPSLIDPGTLTVEGNWIGTDATQASVLASALARTVQCFQIQALTSQSSKTTTVQSTGFVTKFTPMGKISADKAVKFSMEIQFTGTVTLTEV